MGTECIIQTIKVKLLKCNKYRSFYFVIFLKSRKIVPLTVPMLNNFLTIYQCSMCLQYILAIWFILWSSLLKSSWMSIATLNFDPLVAQSSITVTHWFYHLFTSLLRKLNSMANYYSNSLTNNLNSCFALILPHSLGII